MPNILVVDDSMTVRKILVTLFKKVHESDFHVEEAENGTKALIRLKKGPVDLLVTDFEMPEVDGLTLVKLVKQMPLVSHKPIFVVSAMSNAKKVEFEEAGVQRVFFKPLDENRFVEAIREVFPQYRR